MKKVLFGLLVSVMCVSVLPAQEEEEGDSMFSPSISVENELTINTQTLGENEKRKGTVEYKGLENETTATFGVGIAIVEGFSLKPYISDAITVGDNAQFSQNDFTIGLGGEYSPMDMLAISFDLGYIARIARAGEVDDNGSPVGPDTWHIDGIKFGAGVGANIESIFLEMGLNYKFKGMFAKIRYDKESDEIIKGHTIDNTITLEAKMDFFNFIKEGLNSGLVLSNETKITSEKTVDVKENKKDNKSFAASREISNEFAIGLHFAPVEFIDFTFLTKVNSASKKVYMHDTEHTGYVAYGEGTESTTAFGLGIGLAFTKGIFAFGIEYNPTLSEKVSFKASKDASSVTKTNKDLGQELKVTFGIEL